MPLAIYGPEQQSFRFNCRFYMLKINLYGVWLVIALTMWRQQGRLYPFCAWKTGSLFKALLAHISLIRTISYVPTLFSRMETLSNADNGHLISAPESKYSYGYPHGRFRNPVNVARTRTQFLNMPTAELFSFYWSYSVAVFVNYCIDRPFSELQIKIVH